MPKRTSDKQLTKDEYEDANLASPGVIKRGIERASADILAQRRFVRAARSRNPPPPVAAAAKPSGNPFGSVSLVAEKKTNPFGNVQLKATPSGGGFQLGSLAPSPAPTFSATPAPPPFSFGAAAPAATTPFTFGVAAPAPSHSTAPAPPPPLPSSLRPSMSSTKASTELDPHDSFVVRARKLNQDLRRKLQSCPDADDLTDVLTLYRYQAAKLADEWDATRPKRITKKTAMRITKPPPSAPVPEPSPAPSMGSFATTASSKSPAPPPAFAPPVPVDPTNAAAGNDDNDEPTVVAAAAEDPDWTQVAEFDKVRFSRLDKTDAGKPTYATFGTGTLRLQRHADKSHRMLMRDSTGLKVLVNMKIAGTYQFQEQATKNGTYGVIRCFGVNAGSSDVKIYVMKTFLETGKALHKKLEELSSN